LRSEELRFELAPFCNIGHDAVDPQGLAVRSGCRFEPGLKPSRFAVGPDDSVFDALGKATRNQLGRLAVLKDSRLVGYLSLKDITHVLALRGLLDGNRSAHGAVVGARGPERRAA